MDARDSTGTEIIDLAYIEKQLPKIPKNWYSVGKGRDGESCPVAQMIMLDVGELAALEVEENFVHFGGDWENAETNIPTSDGVHLLINLVDICHVDDEIVTPEWFARIIEYIKELGFH
jgi:hypothetical protein